MTQNQNLRTFSAVLAAIVSCAMPCGQALAQDGQAEQLIEEYTEDIQIEKALLERGLGSELSLAMAYQNRGEVYHFYLEAPAKAVEDLNEATGRYRRLAKATEGADTEILEQKFPRALLFCSHALRKEGKTSEALESVAEAITHYEGLVARQQKHCEPPLAFAYKTHVDILINDKNNPAQADLDRATKDATRAIELLNSWAEGGQGEFYRKEIETLRQLLQRATSLRNQ